MRQLPFHCEITPFSRKSGSIVAKVAYRACCNLRDDRAGRDWSYAVKRSLLWSGITTADGGFVESPSREVREKLWNDAEKAERRKDARLGRELRLGLPCVVNDQDEIDEAKTIELGKEIGQQMAAWLVARYGLVTDQAMHRPDSHGDPRNFHIHVVLSSRVYSDGKFTSKVRVLDDRKKGPDEIKLIREEYARIVNNVLSLNNIQSYIDSRSLKEQGIDRLPTIHMGHAATALERKGVKTYKGDINRLIRECNETLENSKNIENILKDAEQDIELRQQISEQFSDIRFGDALFMALCKDPYLRKLWYELDRIEREMALKKLRESRDEGKPKPTIKPLATRLVAALFDAVVIPEIEKRKAEKASQEAARKAAEEAAQRQREAQRRAAEEAAKKAALEVVKRESEERKKIAEEAKREAEERRRRVEAQRKAEAEAKPKPETREEQLARLIGKPTPAAPARKSGDDVDNAINRLLSQSDTKTVVRPSPAPKPTITAPVTRPSQVSEYSATKPVAPASRTEKSAVAATPTVTESPRPKPADDLDNAISKMLSESQKQPPTAHEGGLDAIEKSLDELFAQEEVKRQREREAAWARIERGESEPDPEMTEEERELAELAAKYGNDDDEPKRDDRRVHGRESDHDQSQRRRGRGR